MILKNFLAKTLTDQRGFFGNFSPFTGDFTGMGHDHSDAANGGNLGDVISGTITSGSDTDIVSTFGRGKVGYDGSNSDLFAIAHIDHMSQTNIGFKQSSTGYTVVNGASGQGVSVSVNNTAVGIFTATGLTVQNDTDSVSTFGRASVGYNGADADRACFSHIDQMGETTFALSHTASGGTILNATTGNKVYFAVNDAAIFTLDVDGLIGNAGAKITEFDEDTTMAANSATRGVTQAAVVSYVAANGGLTSQPVDGNYVMGDGAGASIGASNTNTMCFGENAGAAITGSTYNDTIFGGGGTCRYLTGGSNIAFGGQLMIGTGASTHTGGGNIAMGSYSLVRLDTGSGNICIGSSSANLLVSASNQIIIGGGAVPALTTQTQPSIFIGYQVADNLVDGGGANVIIGNRAGYGTGATVNYQDDVFIGYWAGYYANTSDDCVFIGYKAGLGNAAGVATQKSTAVGRESLYSHNSGDNCTAIGYKAGYAISTGDENVCLGYQAGDNITTGSRNIVIGDVAVGSATGDDQFNLGNGTNEFLRGEMGNHILAIYGSNGYLNFGTTLGTSGYGIRDNGGVMEFKDSGGSWTTFASLVN
jgi:hypothetical protein